MRIFPAFVLMIKLLLPGANAGAAIVLSAIFTRKVASFGLYVSISCHAKSEFLLENPIMISRTGNSQFCFNR